MYPWMDPLLENSSTCFCSDIVEEEYSDEYKWFNFVCIILALPAMSVFGVLSNLVNLFIYTRKW